MPVLLAVLKILGVFCLAFIVLIVIALLLPLGFAVEYRPGRFKISAVYGPLRRTVWAHRTDRKKTQPFQKSNFAKEEREPAAAPQQEAAKETRASQGPAQASASDGDRQRTRAPDVPVETAEPLPSDEEEEELPSAAMGRLERAMMLLEENPRALANCVLGHMRWLHRHSVFKMQIRHVDVFWTVTCEDAANTAIAYGAEMAALNTALELAQQTVRIQSDRLWLEPDFTGQRRAERKIFCIVSASAILMIHLLYRIWKDPLLRPAEPVEQQTQIG